MIRVRNPERLGALLALVGVVLLAIFVWLGYADYRYAVDGASTTGTVTGKTSDAPSAAAPAGTQPTYHVQYAFTPPGGTSVSGTDIVGSDDWNGLTVGGPITVQYVRSEPGLNRDAANGSAAVTLLTAGLVLIVGLAFLVVGARFFWAAYARARLRERLLAHGVSATGTIVKPDAQWATLSRRLHVRMSYTYRDQSGHDWSGLSDWLTEAATRHWKAGATGHVRYDPAKPSVSVWLGAEDASPS